MKSFIGGSFNRLPRSTTNFNRYMGLRFGPRRGGGGLSALCAWLAKELDHPLHHACVFFSALDGWEDGGDPVLLVDTSDHQTPWPFPGNHRITEPVKV